ncbi:MAG: hypothetical protein GXY84_03260, partial [Clostridiales bacterium]|nr:hypothetical protein [Clostridiales bacterium]
VPSPQAYRLYVDLLTDEQIRPLTSAEELRRGYFSQVSHLEGLMRSAAQALADITGYASLVMLPRQAELRVSALQLVPVSTGLALLVIVTDGGIIRDAMVQVSEQLDADALYAISRMLSERFSGARLREVQLALTEFADKAPGDPMVLQSIMELASRMDSQTAQDSLTISGTHNILGFPEYQDALKARRLLSALDDRERLLALMRAAEGRELTVQIGPESGIPEMRECSIALAQYRLGRGQRGTIGLIGPTRMPYGRVFGTLRQVSHAMSEALVSRQAAN